MERRNRFIFLDESLILDNNFMLESDSKEKLHCLHHNIKNITYEKFNLVTKYTFEHIQKNIITYGIQDIKNIFSSLSDDEYSELIDYYKNNPNKKFDKFKNNVMNTFFDDDNNIPQILLI